MIIIHIYIYTIHGSYGLWSPTAPTQVGDITFRSFCIFKNPTTVDSVAMSPYQTLIAAECMSHIWWKTGSAWKRRERKRRDAYKWSQDHQKNNISFNRKRGGEIGEIDGHRRSHLSPPRATVTMSIAAKQQHGQWQDLGLSPSGRGPQNDYFDGKVDDKLWLFLVVSLMNFGAPPMLKTHAASPSVPSPGVPRPWDLRHVLWSEMRVMGVSKIGGLWSLAASTELAWNMLEWDWYGWWIDDRKILSMINDPWWSLKSSNFLGAVIWVHMSPHGMAMASNPSAQEVLSLRHRSAAWGRYSSSVMFKWWPGDIFFFHLILVIPKNI